jgi:hypothetical protein
MSQRKALLLLLIGLFLVPITIPAGPIQVNIAFTRASVYDSWLCARGNLTAKLACVNSGQPAIFASADHELLASGGSANAISTHSSLAPEPASFVLLGTGLFVVGFILRHKHIF